MGSSLILLAAPGFGDHVAGPGESQMTKDTAEAAPRVPPVPSIVGIGASAGGVSALQHFFESLPERDVDAAFVVVVHLDPGHQSELAAILAARTRMPVTQVDRPVQVEAGHVYVIPPNRQL